MEIKDKEVFIMYKRIVEMVYIIVKIDIFIYMKNNKKYYKKEMKISMKKR